MRTSIVIAGTHGKTTTTSITGWLLTAAGADPTVLIGGIARNFGADGASYRIGKGKAFVIEGDEYDSAYFDKTAKFLKYLPDIAVVNNIEFDHADIYADLDEVRLAFRRLVNLVPRSGLVLLGSDSPDAAALAATARSRVQTFGLGESAEWRATRIRVAGGTSFHVSRGGQDLGEFTMAMLGEHNVRNALAAIAVGADLGLDVDTLRQGLAQFTGVKRRLEVVGVANGVTIYDDFAHHPTAVDETLARDSPRRSGSADVGHLRASLGVIVPSRVPGRLCARVRRRRPGRAGVGLPIDPAAGRASVGKPAHRRSGAAERPGPSFADRRRDCRRRGWRGPRRRLDRRHVERRLRRHSPEIAGRIARMKIRHCGDSMLLVELEPVIDPIVNERAIRLASRIRARSARGVRDVAPGYCTLGVHFDPLQTDLAALEHAIEVEFSSIEAVETITERAVIEIPVQYGGDGGPDLKTVAGHAGCSSRR